MLSICIPVYNYDVRKLAEELHNQLAKSGVSFEILLMDDASDEAYREKNRALASETIHYIQLSANIGRSRIRNKLAEVSRYPYLLFMDCDSGVASPQFILNYLHCCKPMVVCYGGRIYEKDSPHDDTFLRWKYGVERESAPAPVREKNPNYSFCTNNFLIDREVFRQVRFNEELEGYGHEDTLFGLELLGKGITIKHTDNPLIHLGLESASVFLKKTENGIRNLYRMDEILKKEYPQFTGHSKLIRTQNRLKKRGLIQFTAFLFASTRESMKKNLLGKKPSLLVMDFYKLGLMCSVSAGSGK